MASRDKPTDSIDAHLPPLPNPTPATIAAGGLRRFLRMEALGGIVLVLCALFALAWANTPMRDAYHALWRVTFSLSLGDFALSKPLLLWINDGLMAVFFFVVGLEIKREALVGELASVRGATLPIAAALGGMLVPATIYLLVAPNEAIARVGWGVPMATDIAFALGVLLLLGKRVPIGLKLFLTAVAIVDDIGAVLVIAIFYTDHIAWGYVGAGLALFVMLRALSQLGVRDAKAYAVVGVLLWVMVLKSGVHATVAGVLVAMAIPVRYRLDTHAFLARCRQILHLFERSALPDEIDSTSIDQRDAIRELELACEHAESPLERIEHGLHPWVTYAILPVFALANAGVSLSGGLATPLLNPVSLAIVAGLVLGKPLGILSMSWLVVRLGVADLPSEVGWRHMLGVSLLAGIGFTMALFIAGLAFGDSDLLDIAKVGILAASLLSALLGTAVLYGARRRPLEPKPG